MLVVVRRGWLIDAVAPFVLRLRSHTHARKKKKKTQRAMTVLVVVVAMCLLTCVVCVCVCRVCAVMEFSYVTLEVVLRPQVCERYNMLRSVSVVWVAHMQVTPLAPCLRRLQRSSLQRDRPPRPERLLRGLLQGGTGSLPNFFFPHRSLLTHVCCSWFGGVGLLGLKCSRGSS